jgi:tetratricopeptide (TPR) repeat protein
MCTVSLDAPIRRNDELMPASESANQDDTGRQERRPADVPTWCNDILVEIWAINRQRGKDPVDSVDDLRALLNDIRGHDDQLPAWVRAVTLLNLSSVLINLAGDAQDIDALLEGAEIARECFVSDELTDTELRQSLYNQATAYSTAADLRSRSQVNWNARVPGDWASARWAVRDWLLRARRLLREAAGPGGSGNAEQSGMALCNLANALDASGRWVEAYDQYVHALERDPMNGNAAGNAAVLIGRAANAGWGNRVHLFGLYDRYLLKAHELRDRTVEIAGERAARLYDEMKLSGSDHAGDEAEPLDGYQAWVLEHRLALTTALEGIGHSNDQWDDAFLNRATTPIDSTDPPAIFVMLNLIKADYLVARRLLHRAETMLDEEPYFQHPDDSGSYMDTLDEAAYGEPMAMLILAQRSALDVLDKLSVATNEHFAIGVKTRDVYFSSFWTEQSASTPGQAKEPKLRNSLLAAMPRAENTVLAMAELALDMTNGGMHEQARKLRNAGTHRFALLTRTPVPDRHSIDTFTVEDAHAAALEALAVARAAFLYLVAGLDIVESDRPEPSVSIPVSQQRKAAYYRDELAE